MRQNMIKVLIILAVVLTAAAGISIVYCSVHIDVKHYSIDLPGYDGHSRIVLVSDMHNKIYGKDNEPLLELIGHQKPEAIFAIGDIMGRNAVEKDISNMVRFLSNCSTIAPVIYSPGNHERGLVRAGYRDIYDRIEAAGIPVLNNTWMEYELGGQRIALGGTIDHAYPFEESEADFLASGTFRMLKEMEESGLPTVVLAHKPDSFGFEDASKRWNIGLVLSGHTHGGVIRLPFIGGLASPGEGFLPKYDVGYYRMDDIQMLIGAGLSGYAAVPRVFNPPEICVVEIN